MPDRPWYRRVVEALATFQDAWDEPDRYGTVGSVVVVAWLIATLWQQPDKWLRPEMGLLLTAGLWASTLGLTLVPSLIERGVTEYPVRWLKLYRLSGAACGVLVFVGTLWWGEGLWYVLFGSALPAWLLYGLALAGGAFAYAAGLDIQYWFYHRRNEEEGREPFYKRMATEVSAMVLIAQGLLIGCTFLLVEHLPGYHWHLLVIAPALLMVASALHGRQGAAGRVS